ncbi:hypothetical protein [Corallincola spongiicola]|uniref:Uncharacterized protein n=1 Tax=Corallincola spongiicola TaxID=2520508 RepID=A0ABY1WRS1_9GAMM|nr:hypothetical protein [Corallincola spongiicola]TAA47425.1 hypothetical protein EXY25_09370 [Corallincola spongiicola]
MAQLMVFFPIAIVLIVSVLFWRRGHVGLWSKICSERKTNMVPTGKLSEAEFLSSWRGVQRPLFKKIDNFFSFDLFIVNILEEGILLSPPKFWRIFIPQVLLSWDDLSVVKMNDGLINKGLWIHDNKIDVTFSITSKCNDGISMRIQDQRRQSH